MAADFLESNLFNPTAPTEQFLKRTRRKKVKADAGEFRRQNRKGSQPPQDSNDRTLSGYQHQHNSNNNYIVRNNNRSRRPAICSGESTNNSNSKIVKNENVVSSHITHPMITKFFSEGLVKIPEPPNHPRQVRSSNSKPNISSRRERVRKSVSQNLPPEANLFACTREILFQETQFQNSSIQMYTQDQLLQHNLTLGLRNLKDPGGDLECSDTLTNINISSQQDICHYDVPNKFNQEHSDVHNNSLTIHNDLHIKPSDIELVSKEEEKSIDENSAINSENVSTDANGRNNVVWLDNVSAEKTGDVQKPQSINEANKSIVQNDKENLLQMHRDFRKINLTHEKNAKCSLKIDSFDKINQSSFRETLEDISAPASKENETMDKLDSVDQTRTLDNVHLADESVMKSTNSDETKENNISHSRRTFSKRKQFLRLLHLLFGIRWKKNKKDDKKYLIEEENTEQNGSHQDCTTKHKKKKKGRCKQSQNDKKETKLSDSSSSTKKKRKRPRKKNVYRAGHRIKKGLGYGCRYIGHGLANMTSIIPEASYMNPLAQNRMVSCEYISKEYYDPNAPAWEYGRNLYVTNH